MKNSVFIMVGALALLAGCDKSESQQAAVTAAPAEAQKIAGAPAEVEIPDAPASSIREYDAGLLAKASWTGKACDLKVDSGDSIALSKGAKVVLQGYLVDPANSPAGNFDLVLKGDKSYAIALTTGYPRPDVAEYFKAPSLATAGFAVRTGLESVAPGTYTVDFVMDRDGATYFCESGKKVVVE